MLDARLAHQSRARELTAAEQALARALEDVFATGTHAFADVAQALQSKNIERPSGTSEPWSEAALHSELSVINRSLDEAYLQHGIGA
jgi:hypothetical protein